MIPLHELQLRVLQRLRDATAVGVISWKVSETDPDWFYTDDGPVESFIHFKWPSYNGDEGSDRDFVEVGGAGRFMIGTPGWLAALEVLAAGFEDWDAHVQGLRKQLEREAQRITDAIAAHGRP